MVEYTPETEWARKIYAGLSKLQRLVWHHIVIDEGHSEQIAVAIIVSGDLHCNPADQVDPYGIGHLPDVHCENSGRTAFTHS